jgi:hypothetical protein
MHLIHMINKKIDLIHSIYYLKIQEFYNNNINIKETV